MYTNQLLTDVYSLKTKTRRGSTHKKKKKTCDTKTNIVSRRLNVDEDGLIETTNHSLLSIKTLI